MVVTWWILAFLAVSLGYSGRWEGRKAVSVSQSVSQSVSYCQSVSKFVNEETVSQQII